MEIAENPRNRVGKIQYTITMKHLEISIPQMGKTAGTTAWVAEQLSKAEFKISSHKEKPCILYKLDGQDKWHVAAMPIAEANVDDHMFYREYYDMYIEHAQDPNPNVWGMFRYLTPAAEKYVESFLEHLADHLENEVLSEKEIECTFEIKQK